MKIHNHIFRSFIFTVALSLFGTGAVYAKSYTYTKETSGTQSIGIHSAGNGKFYIGDKTTTYYDDIGDIEVSTGDVNITIHDPITIYISGHIKVDNGGTVTIKMKEGISGNCVLKRKEGNLGSLILLEDNGSRPTLKITGNGEKSRIVIHGNGKFNMPEDLEAGTRHYPVPELTGDENGKVKSNDAVINARNGKVTLKYTDIVHNYNNAITNGTSDAAGGINISIRSGNSDKYVTLEMDHCTFEGCATATRGAALLYYDAYSEVNHSSVVMTNCEVIGCYSFGYKGYSTQFDSYGQVIRTIGSSRCPLKMTDCNVHDNISNNGCIVGVNPTAADEPSEIISCKIYNNRTPVGYSVNIGAPAKIQSCEIHHNQGEGGGLQITAYNSTNLPNFRPYDMDISMDEHTKIYENHATSGAGGVRIAFLGQRGDDKPTTQYKNYQTADGVWKKKTDGSEIVEKVTIDGSQIYDNTSESGVAGVHIGKRDDVPDEYITGVYIYSGTIYNNRTTNGDGGGFKIEGKLPVVIGDNSKTLSVYGNEAKSGGAFYICLGAVVTVNECEVGKLMYPNKATSGNGGGMYVERGKININGATFHYNQASGTGSGGNGGGLYISSGSVEMTNGIFSNNKAENCGGAFYVSDGAITMTGGEIYENESTNGDGGAFYVSDGDDITLTDGTISNNTATGNGGGAYVSGGTVTFSGNLKGNTAMNGGGLYLASQATMTFKGGIISGNSAVVRSESGIASTAYNSGNGTGNVEGCGGGIYLDSGAEGHVTSLNFDLSEASSFGLYSNLADKGGDDLVSEGIFTSIVLPDVSEMSLAGFEGKDANPDWYEDYFTGDTSYDKGTFVRDVSKKRYRDLLGEASDEFSYHRIPLTGQTASENIAKKYLCLTLGYQSLKFTLKVTGLVGSECAKFRLIRHGAEGNAEYDLLFNADAGNPGTSTKVFANMAWGDYSILPVDGWNWAYDPVTPVEHLYIANTWEYEHTFEMKHKNTSQIPLHEEHNVAL